MNNDATLYTKLKIYFNRIDTDEKLGISSKKKNLFFL